jgi:perosamine synthetase
MSNIQAAIGCAQMKRIEALTTQKRNILEFYRAHLTSISDISLNPEIDGILNGAWMPTVNFHPSRGVNKDLLQDVFKRENIDARVFFHPLTSLPFFNVEKRNKNSYMIAEHSINLPSFHDITKGEQSRVAEVILKLCGR